MPWAFRSRATLQSPRTLLAFVATMCSLLGGVARESEAQVSVDRLEMHFYPGRDSVDGVIAIRNETDSTQQVRLFFLDWVRDSVGGNVFTPAGSHESSCASRLEVFPLTLQLASRRSEFARLTYTPTGPDDVGCWAIVMVEPVRPPEPADFGRMGATITVQTGVKVYVHPARSVEAAAVEYADMEERLEVTVPGSAGRADTLVVRELVVRFVNTGNDHLRVRTNADVRDGTTQLVAQLTGPEAYITPGAFRDVIIRLPALTKGNYLALVMLDYGADEVSAAQIEFEIP